MEFRNIDRKTLDAALEKTNNEFDGNIVYKRMPEHVRNTRQGGPVHLLTLTVIDSSAPGARRAPSGRRVSAACWHVHGTFFDHVLDMASDDNAAIIVKFPDRREITKSGGNWVDWNAGSRMYPAYASELCEC